MKIHKQRKANNIVPYSMLFALLIVFIIFTIAKIKEGNYGFVVYLVVFALTIAVAYLIDSKNGLFSGTVEIDERGIIYSDKRRTYAFLWSEIKLIGFTKMGLYMGIKDGNRALVITTLEDLNISFVNMNGRVTKDILVFQNRKGVIQEIKKHWDGEILNERKSR